MNNFKYIYLLTLFLKCNSSINEKELIGKWEIDKIYFKEDSLNTNASIDPLNKLIDSYKNDGYYLEFKEAKYNSSFSFRTQIKGDWTIENNSLHLKNGNEIEKLEIVQLDEKN